MMRRVGSARARQKHYRISTGVYAILPLKEQFFVDCPVAPPMSMIQLPGVEIDPGETPASKPPRE